MAQGQIQTIKDWGVHKGGPKHKYSIKLENDANYYNTTNGAFAQTFKQGDFCTIEADEFPPGSGTYWFNRFGTAAPSSPAPESAGVIAGKAAESMGRPQPSMVDTQMEIWCQSILKSWIGSEDDLGTVQSKVHAVYALYPNRQGNPQENLSEGLADPEFNDNITF